MFTRWVQEMLLDTPLSGVIAIDGKTVRGSRKKGEAGIHMANAWATDNGIALDQLKVDAKSNEITAVPELLETLAIEGCLVTADAMSCQKRIATKIQKKGADYLLAVKQNQRKLYGEIEQKIEQYWASTPQDQPSDSIFAEQSSATHGRHEHRRCWAMHDMTDFPVAQSRRGGSENRRSLSAGTAHPSAWQQYYPLFHQQQSFAYRRGNSGNP